MLKGCDISSYQGFLDISLLSKSYQFIIHRAFVGNDHIDPLFASHAEQALDFGLAFGLYQFVYPLPPAPGKAGRDPTEQAQMHFDAVSSVADKIKFHACDLEFPDPSKWATWGCSAGQIRDWMTSYLAKYEELSGKQMVIYADPSFLGSMAATDDMGTRPLWIASYTSKAPQAPAPWQQWALWQFSGSSKWNGITIDEDYAQDLSLF